MPCVCLVETQGEEYEVPARAFYRSAAKEDIGRRVALGGRDDRFEGGLSRGVSGTQAPMILRLPAATRSRTCLPRMTSNVPSRNASSAFGLGAAARCRCGIMAARLQSPGNRRDPGPWDRIWVRAAAPPPANPPMVRSVLWRGL